MKAAAEVLAWFAGGAMVLAACAGMFAMLEADGGSDKSTAIATEFATGAFKVAIGLAVFAAALFAFAR